MYHSSSHEPVGGIDNYIAARSVVSEFFTE